MMWAAEVQGWQWPPIVVWFVIIFSILCLVLSAAQLIRWLWHFLPEYLFQRKFMGPLMLMGLGVIAFVGGGAWYYVTLDKNTSEDRGNRSSTFQPTTTWSDQLDDWSVSIETMPGIYLPDERTVVFQEWRLVNISKLHKRIIDIEITIPANEDRLPEITFKTAYYQDTGYMEELKKRKKSRGWSFLGAPIELEPQGWVEGGLDFLLPENVVQILKKEPELLRLGATTVTMIDRISGKKVTLLFGEHFNALTGEWYDPRHQRTRTR